MPTVNYSAVPRSHLVGKMLRWPLRLIPASMSLRVLQGPLKGATWIAGAHTHGCWLGSYELEKQRILASILGPGQVFADVGSHSGFYALLAGRLVGAEGHVYAFEPNPRNFQYLVRHLELNAQTNAEALPFAVANASGRIRFASDRGSAMGGIDPQGDLEVETVSLDSFFDAPQRRAPDVLKIDVEGAEADVLRGASRLIESHVPRILLATHGTEVHVECLEILRGLGYRLAPIESDDIETTSELLAVHESDYGVYLVDPERVMGS